MRLFKTIAVALLATGGWVPPAVAEPSADPATELRGPVWVLSAPQSQVAGARPVQGLRGPAVSPDGKQIAFTAVGDLWITDLDEKMLAQGKPPKVRQLIKDPSLDLDAAWSPDGKQLAFVSDRGGKPDIWLRDLKTGKYRQLTKLEDAVAMPSWSPDSKRIAFFKAPSLGRPDVRSLHVVTVFTGDITDIRNDVQTAGPVTWSADGKTLALKTVMSQKSASGKAGDATFLLISLSGGPERLVAPSTGLAAPARRGDGPAWSPDGSKIAYVNDGSLWVAPVVEKGGRAGEMAGAPQLLTSDLANSPTWTGDSQAIVYVSADRVKRIGLNGTITDVQPDLAWQPDVPSGRLVVWAGRLWDGIGPSYRENVDVVMDGNVITAIEPHRQRTQGERVVNASRKTVVPGLIDSRVRLSATVGERLGRLLLAYGITSVRDWGDDPYGTLERRESWSSGRRHGPRVFSTVMILPGGTQAWEKRVVFELERARHLGYDVAAKDARLADHAGEENQLKPMTIGMRRADRPQDMATRPGMTLIPSLALDGGFVAMAMRNPAILSNTQYRELHSDTEMAALTAWVEKSRPTQGDLERSVTTAQNNLHALKARGGSVVLGSGAPGTPYGLGFLVECMLAQAGGLSPLQVLQMVTSGAAVSLGVDDRVGTVMPGKLADLAIIDGDPLATSSDLANVAGVIADGHYFIIDELLRN